MQLICVAKVERVEESAIRCSKDGQEHVIADADTLVLAVGCRPDERLEELLKECGMTYHVIGDGEKAGNLKDAITQGYQIAKDL